MKLRKFWSINKSYIFSLQEVKSQPQNMLMDSLFTDQWTQMFSKILCRQGYVVAKSQRLQGIMLLVYTQLKHLPHLRDIVAQYTKTGLGGFWVSKYNPNNFTPTTFIPDISVFFSFLGLIRDGRPRRITPASRSGFPSRAGYLGV